VTDRRTDGQTELRWLRRAESCSCFRALKPSPQKGAEDGIELAPALTHSYWLNSLNYFSSRHSAAFLYLCSHSYPAKPTVTKFPKLNSSLFSESYLRLLLANHTQMTPSIYTITHIHLLSSAPYCIVYQA